MKLRLLFLFFFVTLALPAVAAAQTPLTSCNLDCAIGYHASGPPGSCDQRCVPDSTPTSTPRSPQPACILSANPGAVYVGDTVNLSWSSRDATGGTITSIGSVGPSGTQGVIPTASSHSYTGTFTGPGGATNCYVTVGILQGNGSDAGGGVTGEGGPGGTSLPPPTGQISSGAGLIPCSGTDCQACHLAGLAQNIINWLVGISIPLAAAMFAYAGIIYFTSGVEGGWNAKTKAHDIFKSVGIGFLIVICAWLGIQTILKTVLSPGFYQSWNEIQCVDNGKRPTTKTVQDLLSLLPGLSTIVPATTPGGSTGGSIYSCGGNSLVNGACYDELGNYSGQPTLQQTGSNSGLTCPPGLSVAGNGCYDELGNYSGDAIPSEPFQSNTGDCSLASLSQDFDDPGDVAAMSCVLPRESGGGCNPNLGSRVDVGTDGHSVSWGQAQINISANRLTCDGFNNGQTVDCPKAFNAPYTGRNHNVHVIDQDLYNQCVEMAKNIGCNRETAQGILNTQGICAWGAARACNVGC